MLRRLAKQVAVARNVEGTDIKTVAEMVDVLGPRFGRTRRAEKDGEHGPQQQTEEPVRKCSADDASLPEIRLGDVRPERTPEIL